MLAVKPYYSDDYNKVLLLLKEFAPQIKDENWELLLKYKWDNSLGYKGMILIDDEKTVGFLSLVLHQRDFENKKINFCNLSSWIVNTEHRGKSLQLLAPIFNIKNIVILNLSPHKNTLNIFNALRFDILSENEYLINPIKLKFFTLKQKKRIFVTNTKINSQNLDFIKIDNRIRKLIIDHSHLNNLTFYCIEIKNNDKIETIFICLNSQKINYSSTIHRLKEIPYILLNKNINYELIFCSSVELLKKYFSEIIDELMSYTNARIINISEHFVDKADLGLAYVTKSKKDRPIFMYTDTNINPSEIDFLYTEKVLLNF